MASKPMFYTYSDMMNFAAYAGTRAGQFTDLFARWLKEHGPGDSIPAHYVLIMRDVLKGAARYGVTDDQMFDAMARAALEAMSRSWMTDEAVLRSARRDRDSALEGRDNALRRCAELEERLRLHTEIREHDAKVEAATRDTLKVDVTFNVVPDTSGVRAEVLGMLPQIEEAVRRAVRTPPA